MRKILDVLFKNNIISIIIPITIAAVAYLLFIIFGVTDDKTRTIILIPILSIVWFFGCFLIFYIQVKNPICPEWFLNLFELLAVVIFGLFTIIQLISFVLNLFQNFNIGVCLGLVTFSSVSWAHNKRK